MRVVRWARLEVSTHGGLRLGAWYPVTALTASEAHVTVHGRLAKLPRSVLELRVAPPREWTVVRGPLNGARMPADLREGYLVCPNCRHRDPLPGARVPATRCPRCNEAFPVAWDDAYPRPAHDGRELPAALGVRPDKVTTPVRETLAPDRRMTRRRSFASRRIGLERRSAERRVLVFAAILVERRVANRRQLLNRRSGQDRRGGIERRRRAAGW